MTHKVGWFVLALLIFCACLPFVTKAQSTTDGAIGGTVTDQSGGVVPKASVAAENLGTGRTFNGTTDGGGRYLITRLQPGVYSVQISTSGFATFQASNVTVEVGRVTTIDATLGVATKTETVEATAEAPVITTDRPDFSTNINETTIDNLPINGRRWSSFALGTPGAVPDGGFGLVSFRGISGLLNNNTVDGADNNQAFFSEERGRTRISYSTSEASIQGFQINTSDYSAEYGGAAGGVVNAVTKSGTNQIHGQAFWYYRDSDLGAINPFSLQKQVVGGVTTLVPFQPPDKRHQFGGGIGGPIIKNKLFFFFSGDQQLRTFPAVANSGTPGAIFAPLTAAEIATLTSRGLAPGGAPVPAVNAALTLLTNLTGNVPRTGDQLILLPKIDWSVNSSNHVSFTYNRLRWASPTGIQTAGVVNRGVESFGNDFVKEDWGIARLASTFTPTITNELRYQIGRDFEFQDAQPPITGEPVSAQGVSAQISIGSVGGFTFGKPNFLNRRAFPKEMRNQIADTVAWSRGAHLFKFGFDINHVNDIEDNLFEESGAYSYTNRVDYISDFAANANSLTPRCGTSSAPADCYSNFAQQLGPTKFAFSTNDLAFFVQDDWRIRPRLTLNLGLRYETEMLPSPQIPNPSLPGSNKFASDHRDFGPRLGFAWDMTGQGKMILRGGYGIFYGRIINSSIANAITNTGVLASSQLSFFFLPTFAGAPIYPNVLTTAPPPATFTPQVVQFAPDTHNPMVHEFDLDFEREIATNTVVSVSYLGSLGRNLPRFVDVNLPAPSGTVTYTVAGGSAFNGQQFTVPLFTGARPNTNFSAITNISDSVSSAYNALVIALNRRFYQGFQIQTSFTFSHATDDGQGSQTFTATNNVLNPFDLGLESGRSTFDIRERFVLGAVWTPDFYKHDSMLMKRLLNGFTIAPLVAVSSGAPYTGTIFGNAPGSLSPISSGILGAGGTNRPPFIPINGFQMPHTVNVDLRLEKGFSLWENAKFTITGDAFNLFNHNNVTGVDTQIYSVKGTALNFNGHFGVPTQSGNSIIAQRQIQIGARLDF